MATTRPRIDFDADGIAKDLGRIGEVSERVRLASYGQAAPLLRMRERQMAREVARSAARKGADDPEVGARKEALARASERFGQFRAELGRTQVQPPEVKAENAGIWGRVVRGHEPVVDASVVATAGGKRAAFTCTDGKGGFKLEVPAGQDVLLSIVLKDGSAAFRDRDAATLQPGEVAFREIDLAGVAPPCAEPPETPPPKDDSFAMVKLVGQLEADAQKLIKAQGLVLGDRSTKVDVEQAGRVIDQTPAAGAKVRPNDTVAIVVATDDKVDVPSVLGMAPKDAEVALLKVDLKVGKITEIQVEAEKSGTVLNQTPVAGDRAPRKSEVAMDVGVPKRQVAVPVTADPKLARVVDLAATRLRDGATDATIELAPALQKLKIQTLTDLDKLIAMERTEVRDKLVIRTLAETDRVIAALKKARKELGE